MFSYGFLSSCNQRTLNSFKGFVWDIITVIFSIGSFQSVLLIIEESFFFYSVCSGNLIIVHAFLKKIFSENNDLGYCVFLESYFAAISQMQGQWF